MKKTSEQILKLKKNRTFAHFFEILKNHDSAVYAEYYDGEQIKKISYGEFAEISCRISVQIGSLLGNGNGTDFVGIHLDNSPQWICIYWGILMAGFCPLLLDYKISFDDLNMLLEDADAKVIITDEKEIISKNIRQLQREFLMKELPAVTENFTPLWGTQMAYHTSGTTGRQRIIVFNQNAVLSNLYMTFDLSENSPYLMPDETVKYLAFLPAYHMFGFMTFFCCVMLCAKTLVFLEDRAPTTLLETSRRHGVTHLPAVPLLFTTLIRRIYSKVGQSSFIKRAVFKLLCSLSLTIQHISPVKGQKFAYKFLFRSLHAQLLGPAITSTMTGGAYLSPLMTKRLMAIGFPVFTALGSTEAGLISIDYGTHYSRKQKGSMGHILCNFKLAPIDGEKDKKNIGELYLKGASLHTGRMVKGELLPPLLNEEGWHETGDIVRTDKEENVYFLGRSKDIIVPATGENVYPDEIEDLFNGIKGIDQIAVVGILMKSGDEKIYLLIQPSEDLLEKGYTAITLEVRRRNLSLPEYKQVDRVFISRKELPITNSRKIKRAELKMKIENDSWPMEVLK
jgi:long-subunit acyl-CoA synthetase (AMP-forming)